MVEQSDTPENTPHGIPTTYADTLFRSRLEARWAAFADLAGWQWVYEPFDGAGYVPDFCFTIAGRPVLVEVKPVATVDEARQYLPKTVNGIVGLWKHDVIFAGTDPLNSLYVDFLNGPEDYQTNDAVFSACPGCSSLDLHPVTWEMDCKICGNGKRTRTTAPGYVNLLWRMAGNDTRWSPAA